MMNSSGKCAPHMFSKILLVVGGLNWGLFGVGMLMGKDLNVVNMILGSMPKFEAVVYVLVGLSAVVALFGGCRCAKCMAACDHCDTCPSK